MAVVLNKEPLIDLIAGWCSGAAAVVCCQPVDTILTRYQAGAKLLTLNSALTPSLATKSAPAATATSTRSLIAQVGISKLWRGTIPMVSAVPFQNALLMAGYGLGKRYGQSSATEQNGQLDDMVENSSKRNLYWSIFVGGCTGGVLQSFLMSPVELIKVHLQIHLLSPSSPSSAAAAPPPMTSMWKGLGATLLRDGIPHGVWFLSYEMAKENLGCWLLPVDAPNASLLTTLTPHGNNRYEEYHKQLTIPLLSGAVAATTAWVCHLFLTTKPEFRGMFCFLDCLLLVHSLPWCLDSVGSWLSSRSHQNKNSR